MLCKWWTQAEYIKENMQRFLPILKGKEIHEIAIFSNWNLTWNGNTFVHGISEEGLRKPIWKSNLVLNWTNLLTWKPECKISHFATSCHFRVCAASSLFPAADIVKREGDSWLLVRVVSSKSPRSKSWKHNPIPFCIRETNCIYGSFLVSYVEPS
jgi:hypothetical protein